MWRKRKQFGNAVAILRKSCYNGPDPLRSSCAERFSRGSMKKGDCDTMKKFLALLLALVMSLSLVACGGGDDTAADGGADAEDGGNAETAAYQVAMITDYGDITDQCFNQTTYEACQEFCDAEGLQFEYYKPAGDSTAERVAMVDAAVAGTRWRARCSPRPDRPAPRPAR